MPTWYLLRTFLLTAIAILTPVIPGGAEAPDSDHLALSIRGMQTNGDEFAGEVLGETPKELLVRCARTGQTLRLFKGNLCDFSLKLPSRVTDSLLRPSAVESMVAMGDYLLGRDLPLLAGSSYAQAIGRNPDLRETVEQAYRQGGFSLPPAIQPSPPPRKYLAVSPGAIRRNLQQAEQWARQMKIFVPNTHTIRTPHFLIYSSWAKQDDKHLHRVYEQLYRTLCRQFGIPPEENIWIGRLPVYVFWKKDDYVRWMTEVAGTSPSRANHTHGVAGSNGLFQFVVLGPVMEDGRTREQARRWFYELLVHESTHAFLARYINHRHVVNWLNEGLAETMVTRLVKDSVAARKLDIAKHTLRRDIAPPILPMFQAENIPNDAFYYGAAQGLTRFLLRKDHRKFIRLLREIKEGKSDARALREVYGLTHRQLLDQWKQATLRP